MDHKTIDKYNIPVPRYTSYPPANFFNDSFTNDAFIKSIEASNNTIPSSVSIYIHIPFCRHICHYCGCNSYPMMDRQRVENYVEALKKEMSIIFPKIDKSRKVSQIHYGGGSPTTLSVETLKDINDYIVSQFDVIDNPEIAIECHPGYLDKEYWSKLSWAGFTRVSIGVQDFNNDVLEAVHRRASMLPLEDIFDILRSNGISINMDFIYGLPLQTPDSFCDSIRKAIELSPDRIVTFSYAHVPWVNKNMLKLEIIGLPSQQIKKDMFDKASVILNDAGYKSIGMDHFVRQRDELWDAYKTKKLHRNFQGYCTKRTTGQVYAFGVSGISQLSGAFAQNSKDISRYIENINNNTLSIEKGYELNNTQIVVGKLINMLMCNECIEWEELSQQCNMTIKELQETVLYSYDRMKDFIEDSIVEVNDKGIFMTKEGEIFVRNVAACFDPLLKDSNKSFSKPI